MTANAALKTKTIRNRRKNPRKLKGKAYLELPRYSCHVLCLMNKENFL